MDHDPLPGVGDSSQKRQAGDIDALREHCIFSEYDHIRGIMVTYARHVPWNSSSRRLSGILFPVTEAEVMASCRLPFAYRGRNLSLANRRRRDVQIYNLSFPTFILNYSRIQYLDDIRMLKSPISLNLPHGCLDPLLARGNQDLLERVPSTG